MEERTCGRCGGPVHKSPGPGRWPMYCMGCKTPRELRPSRYKPAPVVDRECPSCGDVFQAKGVKTYCSGRCKNRAKYERRLASGYERVMMDRRNAKYVPKPPRPIRLCSVDGCESKHLAKGFCSSHYRKWRRAEGLEGNDRCPVTVVGSMASLFGAYFPKPKPIKVRVTVGLMAYCPWCSDFMAAASPIHRACRTCGTTATLNPEEVSWATFETHSTAA